MILKEKAETTKNRPKSNQVVEVTGLEVAFLFLAIYKYTRKIYGNKRCHFNLIIFPKLLWQAEG